MLEFHCRLTPRFRYLLLRIEPPQQKIPCSMALHPILASISTLPSQSNSYWIEFANHCLQVRYVPLKMRARCAVACTMASPKRLMEFLIWPNELDFLVGKGD